MSEKASDRYFRNEACPYFPCHPTGEGGYFNCLFCYCPLYVLGESCGGKSPVYRGVHQGLQRLRQSPLKGRV